MSQLLDKAVAGLFSGRAGDRRAAQSGTGQTQKVDRRDLPGGDRRKWACGVIYKTHSSTTIVERWLEEHAAGDWSLSLEDFDDDREGKTLKILFEQERDKQLFAAEFAGR